MRCLVKISLVLCLGTGASSPVLAFDVAAGFAGMDDMDDRMEPAATVHVGWNDSFFAQAFYWGRDFGPVSERNFLLAVGAEQPIGGIRSLVVHYGLATMDERTTLYSKSTALPGSPPPTTENSWSGGAYLGLGYKINFGSLFGALSWDSAVLPAGEAFVIYLAHARKESVSFVLGVTL